MPHEELELETPRTSDDWERERWQCAHCGTEFYDDVESVEVDGDTWCEDCVDDSSFTCDRCDSRSADDGSESVDRGYDSAETWCNSCVDAHTSRCERCHCTVAHDYCETVDGETWCYDCKNENSMFCESCEEYTHMDNSCRINDDNYVCESCFESYYFRCEGC